MRYVSSFGEIEQEFMRRVQEMVYCSAATIDAQGRPRSRVIHPVWEHGVGWFGTFSPTAKLNQLALRPLMALAYIKEPFTPVYVDCRVTRADDEETRQYFWELCRRLPEPFGYAPEQTWGEVGGTNWVLLRLDPWQVELYDLLQQHERIMWRAEDAG